MVSQVLAKTSQRSTIYLADKGIEMTKQRKQPIEPLLKHANEFVKSCLGEDFQKNYKQYLRKHKITGSRNRKLFAFYVRDKFDFECMFASLLCDLGRRS